MKNRVELWARIAALSVLTGAVCYCAGQQQTEIGMTLAIVMPRVVEGLLGSDGGS